jgi:hypothetical protein
LSLARRSSAGRASIAGPRHVSPGGKEVDLTNSKDKGGWCRGRKGLPVLGARKWGSYPVPDGKVVWCDVKTVE